MSLTEEDLASSFRRLAKKAEAVGDFATAAACLKYAKEAGEPGTAGERVPTLAELLETDE